MLTLAAVLQGALNRDRRARERTGGGKCGWWEVWVVEDKLECLAQAREGVAITFQLQVLASLNML